MALLWLPSIFSREHNSPFLALPKPSNTSSHSSTSSLSFYTTSFAVSPIPGNRRSTRVFLTQAANAIEEAPSPSSSSTSSFEEETESEKAPRTRLIAQNIPWSCTIDEIRALFEKYGTVIDIEMSMYNKVRNRGLAFIRMGSEEEALKALTELDSYESEGRVIKVEFATSEKKKKKASNLPKQKHDVFVGNLCWKVKSKDLKSFFESLNANVVAADVVYQTKPRKPAGYGFVSFSTEEDAVAAISNFQGKILMGQPVQLKHSKRNLKVESKDGTQSGETATEKNGNREV